MKFKPVHAIAIFFFVAMESTNAAVVRVLYRPNPNNPRTVHDFFQVPLGYLDPLETFLRPDLLNQLRKEQEGENKYGHVAIQLPMDLQTDGSILGWQPMPLEQVLQKSPHYTEFQSEYERLHRKPGSFQNDALWAKKGIQAISQTKYIEFQVTHSQLQTIRKNMDKLMGTDYEMYPQDFVRFKDSHNCVTALGALLEGTGIVLQIPENGHLQSFINALKEDYQPSPWPPVQQDCAGTLVNSMESYDS